jgi:hypothetical protein
MRVYHHYELWEDWQHGLYRESTAGEVGDAELIHLAAELLRDTEGLQWAMCHVAFNWPHAAEQNLTNPSRNKQAWLGQAACCWAEGVPEQLTKQAWWTLTEEERRRANLIADAVYADWRTGRDRDGGKEKASRPEC